MEVTFPKNKIPSNFLILENKCGDQILFERLCIRLRSHFGWPRLKCLLRLWDPQNSAARARVILRHTRHLSGGPSNHVLIPPHLTYLLKAECRGDLMSSSLILLSPIGMLIITRIIIQLTTLRPHPGRIPSLPKTHKLCHFSSFTSSCA